MADLVERGDTLEAVGPWSDHTRYHRLSGRVLVTSVHGAYIQTWMPHWPYVMRWIGTLNSTGQLHLAPSKDGTGADGYGDSGLVRVIRADGRELLCG